MWFTDTITLQTKAEVNTYGSIKQTWADSTTVLCDVQPMTGVGAMKSRELWGLTDANILYNVYAPAGSGFTEGFQVKYNSGQYLVMAVSNYNKIGGSNNMKAVISKVV